MGKKISQKTKNITIGIIIVLAIFSAAYLGMLTTTSTVPCGGLPIPTIYTLGDHACCDNKIWVVRDYQCGVDDYCWHEGLDCDDYGKICVPIEATDPDMCECVGCIGSEKRCGIDAYSGRYYIEQCVDGTWKSLYWCSSDQVCKDGICVVSPTPTPTPTVTPTPDPSEDEEDNTIWIVGGAAAVLLLAFYTLRVRGAKR